MLGRCWAEDTTVDPIVEPPHENAQELGFREQAPDSLWDGSDDGPWAAASIAWNSGTASGGAGWQYAGCWLAAAHCCCTVTLWMLIRPLLVRPAWECSGEAEKLFRHQTRISLSGRSLHCSPCHVASIVSTPCVANVLRTFAADKLSERKIPSRKSSGVF